MNKIFRFLNSLTTRLQFATLVASLIGIFFSYQSYVQIKSVNPDIAASMLGGLELQLGVALLAQILAWYIIAKLVIMPIVTLIELMRKLGDNNYEVDVPYTTVANQIGSLARKVKIFKDRIIHMRDLEEEQKMQEISVEQDRAMLLQRLSTDFD